MSNEATKTKAKFGYLEKRIFCGRGIDIGCGNDPIYPEARPFDVADGDANEITNYVHEKFDYVFSSHCLEHMRDPHKALREWWALVKPNGYLYLVVPDEDRYEQGVFPSRWNGDHKHTFTVYKTGSWSPVSINIVDLVKKLPDAEILKIEVQDDGYDYGLHDIDQTYQGNGMDAMAQIVIVLKKNCIDIPKFRSLMKRVSYTSHRIYSRVIERLITYRAVVKTINLHRGVSWTLAREKFYSPKYSGIRGKILFFSKGTCIVFSAIPYVGTIQGSLVPWVSKYLAAASRRLYAQNPQPKKLLFFLPNGLGDAIINKCYIDRILEENAVSPDDVILLASDAWEAFKSILYPNITVYFFNLEEFEKSNAEKIKVYKILGKYTFDRALCNLKWKPPVVFTKVFSHVNAKHKYAYQYHSNHIQLNTTLDNWAAHFGVEICHKGAELHEAERIALFYTEAGLLKETRAHRTCLSWTREATRGQESPYIVFHIGNSDTRRRWAMQKFNEVARALTKKGYSVYFCGGTQERDLIPFIEDGVTHYIGVLSPEDYTALIAGAALLLCGDTGPAHLGLALNIPTVIILGGGHYTQYFPYPDEIHPTLGNVTYVTHKQECFGCDWACRYSDKRRFCCIHAITSGMVLDEISTMLGRDIHQQEGSQSHIETQGKDTPVKD